MSFGSIRKFMRDLLTVIVESVKQKEHKNVIYNYKIYFYKINGIKCMVLGFVLKTHTHPPTHTHNYLITGLTHIHTFNRKLD